ncbi:MAG: class I SAM-dependent methyltransferase [Gammaproteobacteria bacterium]
MRIFPYVISLTLLALSISSAYAAEFDADRLADVLKKQPAELQARYSYRNPQETLAFFGVTPDMTVVEALPGRGWYTKILIPYLGKQGQLIGADYAQDMYPKFGFFAKEFIESKKTWVEDWSKEAQTWGDEDSAVVSAFVFGSMPENIKGTADAVLFIRALHNLKRFENDGGYLSTALDNAYQVLKPGGIVGVVQHLADESMSDEWAGGSNGYLKKSLIIKELENAGFEYVDESRISINEKDQPTEKDMVWRLPPSLSTSKDNPELRTRLQAIGESTRITLKFRKPE